MRNNLKYFTFLFIFFIVVALGSLFVLSGTNSVFDRSVNTFGAEEAVLNNMVIGTEVTEDNVLEEAIEDAASEIQIDADSELIQEETEPEAFVAEPEEVITEPEETETVTEPEVVEPETTTPEPAIRYYTYKVSTESNILRLRETPSTDAKILAKLSRQYTGYILQPGNTWCKVYTQSGKTGYVSTEYLVVTEVTQEDFPADIQSIVEAPTEELTSAFDGNG